MALIGYTTNLLRKKPVKMPENLLHSLDGVCYIKSPRGKQHQAVFLLWS